MEGSEPVPVRMEDWRFLSFLSIFFWGGGSEEDRRDSTANQQRPKGYAGFYFERLRPLRWF